MLQPQCNISQQRSSSVTMHQNHEEIELLKAQLSQLEERQKNYDELQHRLEEFEAKERLGKLESDISKSSPAQPVPTPQKYDPETQANIGKSII